MFQIGIRKLRQYLNKLHLLRGSEATSTPADYSFRFESSSGLIWALLLHGLIAVAVFSPFVFRGMLPLWSTDNLYGSYPFVLISRESLWQGWSGWLPYSQSGVDFVGNVTNLSYSPLLLPLLLLPESWMWMGLAFTQLLLYWGLGVLFFLIARREIGHFGWALVAASAFQLSTPILLSLQAFPMICVVTFLLLCVYVVSYLDQLPPARALIYLTAAISGLLLSGHYVQTAYAGVLIGLFFLHRHGFRPRDLARFGTPTTLFITASAIAVAICAFRILPIAASMQDSSRLATTVVGNHATRLHALLQLIFPEIFGVTVYDPLGLGGTAFQFGGAGGNSYISFPNALVGLFNQCGIVITILIFWSFLNPRSKMEGDGFWKWLSLFCLAYLANIWPIPFIANLLVYPYQHGSFLLLVVPVAFCMLAGKAGVALTAGLEKGENPGLHRIAVLMAVAAIYVAMMMSFLWQDHPRAMMLVRFAVLLPIGVAALAYGLRNDRSWAKATASLARTVPWLVVAGVAVFSIAKAVLLFKSDSVVPGEIFQRALWQQGGMLFILTSAICWLRMGRKSYAAALGLTGFVIMSWPAYLSGDSLRLASMAMTRQEALVLVGTGATLSVLILVVVWVATGALRLGRLTGSAFCVLCLLLSVGHSLSVWKEMDALISQPFVRTLEAGGILALRPGVRDMDLRNYRVNFPHGLLEPRTDFVPPCRNGAAFQPAAIVARPHLWRPQRPLFFGREGILQYIERQQGRRDRSEQPCHQ